MNTHCTSVKLKIEIIKKILRLSLSANLGTFYIWLDHWNLTKLDCVMAHTAGLVNVSSVSARSKNIVS